MNRRRETTDVLVIGGGITGCGVAREAALRGLSVLLVEKDDLAAGTSSRSTKLLHGGLRYLEQGHLALVREALREREATAAMAPHLARPLPFLLPTRRGLFPGRRAARLGVALYDLLAGWNLLGRGRGLGPQEVRRLLPELDPAGLTGGVLFHDRQTDDARLTVAVARDAVRRGAALRIGWEVVDLLDEHGSIVGARCRDRETGELREVRAFAVVNACGPWADRVRDLAGATQAVLRVSRGTHLVLRGFSVDRAVMLSGRRPGHRFFVLPWRGVALLGTTDDDHAGGLDDVTPDPGDVMLLLAEAQRHFPGSRLGLDSVLSTFSGLRPLLRSEGPTRSLSRDHRLLEERGMWTIVGGKLTTWRSMAEEVLVRICRRLGFGARHRDSAVSALPGGEAQLCAEDPRLARVPRDAREHLLGLYGCEAVKVADLAASSPEGARTLLPDTPCILAQIDFAVREEFATRLEDVLLRRLPLGHDPVTCILAAPQIAARMRQLLGWSREREGEEVRELAAKLRRREGWRDS